MESILGADGVATEIDLAAAPVALKYINYYLYVDMSRRVSQ